MTRPAAPLVAGPDGTPGPVGPPDPFDPVPGGLSSRVGRGLAWGTLNNLSVRLGNVAVGIVLARLLAPEEFGVFAVALTVQAVLLAVVDLGLGADLIRRGGEAERGPTFTTVSLATSAVLTASMVTSATAVAGVLGSVEAAGAVRVLALTLLLSGASVVPFAVMQRRFMQRQLFWSEAASTVVSTVVVLLLVVVADQGALAMAWARVAGQVVTTLLLFHWTKVRFRLGWDGVVAGDAVRFGAPLAAANLLSWVLLNLDYVVVGRLEGATLLGLYVLAFNLASWPMTAIGQAVRNVALPAFSRQDQAPAALADALLRAVGLAWAATVLMSSLLAVLASPLVVSVYGEVWAASAGPLAALAALGCLRVVFDLVVGFLVSRGAGRTVLAVQVLWVAALVPAMVVGTRAGGIVGAGWAHVAVAALVVLPAYAWAVRRWGVGVRALLAQLLPPLAVAAVAGAAAWGVSWALSGGWAGLLAGGLTGAAVHAALLWRWVLRRLPARGRGARSVSGSTPGDPLRDPLRDPLQEAARDADASMVQAAARPRGRHAVPFDPPAARAAVPAPQRRAP